jgi:hypothetical protein
MTIHIQILQRIVQYSTRPWKTIQDPIKLKNEAAEYYIYSSWKRTHNFYKAIMFGNYQLVF